MEGVVALIMIFGMPVFIVGMTQYYRYKKAKLKASPDALSAVERQKLAQLEADNARMEGRLQNLETIVCSVDFELNQRLNRLAAKQSVLALPSAGQSIAPKAGTIENVSAQASQGELPIGSTLLGRFTVERPLGRGGMGAIYLATDKELGEQVALKVVAHHLLEDPAALERFRREASAARRITHPNVIRIHDLGDHDGMLFISMEYFSGKDLATILRRRDKLPLGECQELLAQVADGLDAAHRLSIVHRDLKPQNVLVNDRSDVRVIDFGLAKAAYSPGMSATGLIMGTPEYMAPEQVQGRVVDHRADLYSLGAMAYHMLSGRPPFVAETPIAVGFLHCSEPPKPLRQLNVDVPDGVDQAIRRCLSKDPAQRFNSAAEFKAEFK
jgi:serine/threonine-protein kinase